LYKKRIGVKLGWSFKAILLMRALERIQHEGVVRGFTSGRYSNQWLLVREIRYRDSWTFSDGIVQNAVMWVLLVNRWT